MEKYAQADIAGRLRNVNVPASKPLLPLFEAVNNSIQAIEDAAVRRGRIEIVVHRAPVEFFDSPVSSADKQLGDVVGFDISDNGIGLDEQNFEAFKTVDTTYKIRRGGKGIGRFSWLVAFNSVAIESVYREDGRTKRRKFTFCARGDGIENPTTEDIGSSEPGTLIVLKGLKEQYRKECPKKLDTLAAYVVEEFLDAFAEPNCPSITLRDEDAGPGIELNDFYRSQILKHSEPKELQIGEANFSVRHVHLVSTHIQDHRLCLCAHGRVVTSEKLTGVPNLARRLHDEDGAEFVYSVYVASNVLDNAVKPDRTDFNLYERGEELRAGGLTLGDIRDGVRDHCREYLLPYTQPFAEKKRERVRRFIENDGAMYRPILRHLEHAFDDIDPEATDGEVDQCLYEAAHEFQTSLRKEGTKLLEAPTPDDAEFEQFKTRFSEYFEKVSEANRTNLTRYVLDRKAVIEFLKSLLRRQDDGRYHNEERVHNIIFPMGKTSDEVLFKDHNLWLLDERLAFHVFLSSDKPLRTAEPLQNDSGKEPDIIVFDKAMAFSEVSEVPFTSITIVEFKKPERKEYTDEKNPFSQVLDSIRDINAGNFHLTDGRSLPIPRGLPFYCYVVCDLTPKLKKWAENATLDLTPDGLGYFGYNKPLNAHFEVISYAKIVSDAEKRHKAFFERLGLPQSSSLFSLQGLSDTSETTVLAGSSLGTGGTQGDPDKSNTIDGSGTSESPDASSTPFGSASRRSSDEEDALLRLREFFSRTDTPQTESEVAKELGANKHEVRKHLHFLVEEGFLEKIATRPIKYCPTASFGPYLECKDRNRDRGA